MTQSLSRLWRMRHIQLLACIKLKENLSNKTLSKRVGN